MPPSRSTTRTCSVMSTLDQPPSPSPQETTPSPSPPTRRSALSSASPSLTNKRVPRYSLYSPPLGGRATRSRQLCSDRAFLDGVIRFLDLKTLLTTWIFLLSLCPRLSRIYPFTSDFLSLSFCLYSLTLIAANKNPQHRSCFLAIAFLCHEQVSALRSQKIRLS
eukprot:31042_6